jgi:glycosyltransferase involved in cell wall biosynthesis
MEISEPLFMVMNDYCNISVVIPLYNKETSISRCLDSVLNQTLSPMEIVVVDDGSVDNSVEIVTSYQSPYIRLIKQKNSGVSSARNKGYQVSSGKWIAFLDADDYWDPGFLQEIEKLMKLYPACGAYGTSYYLQKTSNETRTPIILRNLPFKSLDGIIDNYFRVAVDSMPPICSSAVVVSKIVLEEIDGFPIGVNYGEDLLTWAKVAAITPYGYSTIPKSVYCINATQATDQRKNGPQKDDLVAKGLLEILHSASPSVRPYTVKYLAKWYKMRASLFLFTTNHRHMVILEAFRSVKTYPFDFKAYFYFGLAFLPNFLIRKIKQVQIS